MQSDKDLEAAIFDAGLACATPQERAAYLDKACAGQPELRQHIEALLAGKGSYLADLRGCSRMLNREI
jgi:hypothetical protein